jgi:hypothetical protein
MLPPPGMLSTRWSSTNPPWPEIKFCNNEIKMEYLYYQPIFATIKNNRLIFETIKWEKKEVCNICTSKPSYVSEQPFNEIK